MDFMLLFLGYVSICLVLVSGISLTEFAYPNFTASSIRFVESSGSFLFSRNGTFKAAIFNPEGQQVRFYLCVIHAASNTIVWSANQDTPVSQSGIMSLTANGISVNGENGNLAWSTPPFHSLVSALHLTESGNLVLLDQSNMSLWESFSYPTDTIVVGQKIHVGTVLSGSVSSDDLSRSDYEFVLSDSDATLQWQGSTYWELSMDTNAYVDSNFAVEYMELSQNGLHLFGQNGSAVVIQVKLPPSEFRIVRVGTSGQFIIKSFSGVSEKQELVGPVDECRIPYICGKIGLCTAGTSVDSSVCSCPLSFQTSLNHTRKCVPRDSSYMLPDSCNSAANLSSLNVSDISYLPLGSSVDYFANDFKRPVRYGVNLSVCQDICSNDCGCLGIFFGNTSASCYTIEKALGSVMSRTTNNGRLGYVKAIVRDPGINFDNFDNGGVGFPIVAVVLLPLSGALLMLAVGILLCRKYNRSNIGKAKLRYLDFSIPGLPLRFDFQDLELATDNFNTKIGAGGFGTVYKGTLPDKTVIAVKKITNLGIQGKRDFCAEIATIGNIHHVNLVKLKGYCAQGSQWLLVYEYMNLGSLDKTLFGHGPVLEWKERVEIALGSARGLAYLHTGCDQKIIHCDVKPENILLQDPLQAKISDFGLSKLLSREQSSHFTTMRGTRGYLAPEWLTSSAISDKTDVYSFGMVLLEIVSGRKNCSRVAQSDENSYSTSSSTHGLVYFPLYALEMHEQGRYLELVDPRLTGRVTREEVEKMVRVALCCAHEEPGLRPNMVTVVGMLEGGTPLWDPIIGSLNFLRFYGRRFTEPSVLEGTGVFDDTMTYQYSNGFQPSRSGSRAGYSYVSSQQISGPR